VSDSALRAVPDAAVHGGQHDARGWAQWLRARLDPAWRAGEWDGEALLFTGDLDSARTAAWPCRTPGCPTATRWLPPRPGGHRPVVGRL